MSPSKLHVFLVVLALQAGGGTGQSNAFSPEKAEQLRKYVEAMRVCRNNIGVSLTLVKVNLCHILSMSVSVHLSTYERCMHSLQLRTGRQFFLNKPKAIFDIKA